MSGYTPVFRSVFEGSLCGQYPDTAAWLFLLALQDKYGNIDMTPQYISAITGMPAEDLLACIERFMQPDPASRSDTEDGRRLVLIDPDRPWGWHVVNHLKYREKARKMGYDAARTASGVDATRKRMSREVPRSPAPSRSHTHTQTHTQTERERGAEAPTPPQKDGLAKKPKKEKRGPLAHFVPKDWEIPDEDAAWALKEFPSLDVYAETQKFRDHEFQSARSDWAKTWRNWVRKAAERPPGVINGRR